MSRLGISSSRAFSVGTLDEAVQTKAITTLATAVVGTKVNLEGDRIGRRVIEHLARRGTGDRMSPGSSLPPSVRTR